MSNPKRKRFAFRPAVTESRLEERLVLATGTSVIAGNAAHANVLVMTPPTQVASEGVTPAPAPSPISARAAARALRPLTVARLRKDFARQVDAATRDLRAAIQSQVGRLYANGATPTAQQLADFNASIAGALNATALRLSTQAALLPNGTSRLVPAIQNQLLGSGARSFASRLEALASSGQLVTSSGAIAPSLTRLTNLSAGQGRGLINNFFNTTPVARLSVNSSGQRIPLQRFMGQQLLNQVANTFGSLAQSFPGVANSILFPNGGVTGPTPVVLNPANLNAFNSQVSNALATAAFQLGSGLSLFPNSSNVVTQLQPLLFGAATGATGTTGTTGITGATGTTGATGGNAIASLASALQNLQFGSPDFNTAVSGAFNSAFQNLVTPIAQFFGMTGQMNMTLPTSGFTSLFGSPFTGSSFFNGFNNGFATGTTPGFIGFGQAPTGFNTSFGTGFNNFISGFNQNFGFNFPGIGSGVTGINTGQVGAGSGVTGIGTGQVGAGSGNTGISTGQVGAGSGNTGVGSGVSTGTGGGIV